MIRDSPRAFLGRLGRYQEKLTQLLASHGAEAVAAVYRPVAPRQERYFGVLAALGADRGMHLPPAAAEPAARSSLLVSAGAPASRAAGGLIREPLGSKKLLFADCEDKNSATVPTCQLSV